MAMTYIEPNKCRIDGSRSLYTGLVPFNFRTGSYEEAFDLGRLNVDRSAFTFVKPDELPHWAKELPRNYHETEKDEKEVDF
jgi:hypothetical protein